MLMHACRTPGEVRELAQMRDFDVFGTLTVLLIPVSDAGSFLVGRHGLHHDYRLNSRQRCKKLPPVRY